MILFLLSRSLGSQYKFEIEYVTNKSSVGARFLITTPYGEKDVLVTDPLSAKGGTISDILSFALRIALLELYVPKIEGPFILDEAGKFITEEYRTNMCEFLKRVSEDTKRQIIFITQVPDFIDCADKTFRVSKDSLEVSHVEEQVD